MIDKWIDWYTTERKIERQAGRIDRYVRRYSLQGGVGATDVTTVTSLPFVFSNTAAEFVRPQETWDADFEKLTDYPAAMPH